MSKTSLAVIGAVIAVLIGTGFYAFAKADDESAKPKMMEQAIEKGIISQEQADNLKEFGQDFRNERQKEMFEDRLKTAVGDGTITEDEAQQIRDWQSQMPEAMKKLGPGKGMGKGAMHKCMSE